jgi:hypothetical protein
MSGETAPGERIQDPKHSYKVELSYSFSGRSSCAAERTFQYGQ